MGATIPITEEDGAINIINVGYIMEILTGKEKPLMRDLKKNISRSQSPDVGFGQTALETVTGQYASKER